MVVAVFSNVLFHGPCRLPCLFVLRLQYNLTLTASDTLSENNATVHIKIKDINDLPPKFERGSYEATIPEEDDRGLPKKILQVFFVF